MLDGKVVIVAGGGRGMGAATARNLGRHGVKVIVNDLGTSMLGEGESKEPAEKIASEIEANGGEALAHFGDISAFEYTQGLVEDALETYGRIDGAVNFAGIRRPGSSFERSADDWDEVIRVHMRGHFALYRELVGHWHELDEAEGLESERSFLCVSSSTALGETVPEVNYGAANAGILGMMRTANLEIAEHNIRINALFPGAFTRFYEHLSKEDRPFQPEEMPPEKVAPIVGFLMSDAAAGISGEMIRTQNDLIGRIAPPGYDHQLAFKEGGWTVEAIAERYDETIGSGDR